MAAEDGTAGGMFEFFDWAENKHELPKSQVSNWRGASKTVLAIEEDCEDLDLRSLDLDDFLRRFEIASRTKYKSDSLNAYKGRFRKAVETYRLWLEQSPDWKGAGAVTRPATNGKGKPTTKSAGGVDTTPEPIVAGMINHTFPLRPGVYARLTLPEDLTSKDAQRLANFVQSLAFDDQLAITAG
jgi:hypothetical protein